MNACTDPTEVAIAELDEFPPVDEYAIVQCESFRRPGFPDSSHAHKKVFIVAECPVFCEHLARVVNDEKDLMVCGQGSEVEEALQAMSRMQPELVLVDASLAGDNGLELIKAVRAGNRKIKLLAISMRGEPLFAEEVLRAGGDGYIVKQDGLEEIILAMRDVLGGHLYVSDMVLAGAD